MADSQLALTWRWRGDHWQGVQKENTSLGWGYAIAALIFLSMPTIIVSASVYIFPPMPGSRLAWVPYAWIVLTFLAHLSCLIWLLLEYYQFPLLRYLRILGQRQLNRR